MLSDDLIRAIALNKSGEKIAARDLLENLVRTDPHNETAWIWLADTYPDNPNRYAILRECLRQNPGSQNVQKWLATVKFDDDLSGVIELIRSGKKVDAREILEKIVKEDPQNDSAWIWLAETHPDPQDRIAVLQECLKHNPNSHVAQRWLAAVKEEDVKPVNAGDQDLAYPESDQSEQIQDHETGSSASSSDSGEPEGWRKTKNFRKFFTLLGIIGLILLGGIGVLGLAKLPKQGMSTDLIENRKFTSISTASQIPSSTLEPTELPIVKTSTLTSIPTLTPSPIPPATLTPSLTSEPSPLPSTTSTPSLPSQPASILSAATETLTPIGKLAKQAKGVALNRGFTPEDNACGQYQSCSAFVSEAPYMLLVIMNNGTLTITVDGETLSSKNYVITPIATTAYDDTEFFWYEYVLGDIYNSFSADFPKDANVVLDRANKYGSYEWVTYYGFKIVGMKTNHEINLTITPPEKLEP